MRQDHHLVLRDQERGLAELLVEVPTGARHGLVSSPKPLSELTGLVAHVRVRFPYRTADTSRSVSSITQLEPVSMTSALVLLGCALLRAERSTKQSDGFRTHRPLENVGHDREVLGFE